jgi:hypothetical protein
MHLHEHCSVNRWKKNIQCCQLKFFQYRQHNFYVSVL